jgi:HNH endonuclease
LNIDSTHITLTFLPEHTQFAEDFFRVYDLISQDFVLKSEIHELKDPKNRTCRFCNFSYPKVTFNKKAHTIPEFLGNTGSLSDFECDTCNKHFGKLENQLSNFIGAAITLNRTKGKKKIPNSPSYDKKIIAKKTNFLNAKTAIEFGSTENSPEKITFDEETNQYSVEFITQPFIPYDVYKALLKLALGLLPETDLKEFELAFQLLQDTKNRRFVKSEALSMQIHNLSAPFTYTGIFLFKKRDITSDEPPLSLVLFYGQFMYQIFIPFSWNYMKLTNTKKISCPLLPPILTEKDVTKFHFTFETERLDSLESRTRTQYIKLTPSDRDVKRVALDPLTKKEVKDHVFNPHTIVKFMIIDDENFSVPISPD